MSFMNHKIRSLFLILFIFIVSGPGPAAVDDPESLKGMNFLSWYRNRAGQADRPMYYEASIWSSDPKVEDPEEINRLKIGMNRNLCDADIRALKASGVNSVRFKLGYALFTGGIDNDGFHDPNEFDDWWNTEEFERLRRVVNRLGDHGIMSILTLTNVPGGANKSAGLGCRLHHGQILRRWGPLFQSGEMAKRGHQPLAKNRSRVQRQSPRNGL